jgi:hypothetical protein
MHRRGTIADALNVTLALNSVDDSAINSLERQNASHVVLDAEASCYSS